MQSAPTMVLGVAALLVLISALPALAERFAVPTTVLLAVFGCLIGVVAGFGDAQLWVVSDIVRGLGELHLPAELVLTIFLPILLFESAIHLDTRSLLDDLGPVLLLAIVAVVVTTVLSGVTLWLASGFALSVCLLLASIVATTDPVAVIGVFNDLGAPQRLRVLVEGESLLNDAAAIALFSLFLGVVTGQHALDPLAGAVGFFADFLGGGLVGLVLGRLGCFGIRWLDEHRVAEITLSLAIPYLAYILADTYAGVSGVVAVIAAGLVIGNHGRTRLSDAVWQSVTSIWAQLSFWASSFIFVLASMFVPITLVGLGLHDVLLVVVLVAAALVARALVLWVLLPALSRGGIADHVDGPYRIVMLWGGLRGAVTLTLALAIRDNPLVDPESTQFVTVLATSFVLFTLLVQATTLRPLIHWLQLERLSPTDRTLRRRVLELALTEIIDRLDTLAREMQLDPDAVKEVEARYRERCSALAAEVADRPGGAQDLTACLQDLSRHEVELSRRLLAERIASHRLGALLVRQATTLLDDVRVNGADAYLARAERLNRLRPSFRAALWLQRRIHFGRLLARLLADHFELLLARILVVRDLQAFVRDRLRRLHPDAPTEAIDGLLRSRLAALEGELAAIKLQYPGYGRILQARYLARIALRREEASYRTLHAQGLVSRELHGELMRDVRRRRRSFERVPPLNLELDVISMVSRVPLFQSLSDERVRAIAALLRPRLAAPGERLVERGSRGDQMFFIGSGAVEVAVEPKPIELGTGEFFGEIALLTRQRRTADVTARGFCRLLVLHGKDFRRFLRADPILRREIDRVARERLQRRTEG